MKYISKKKALNMYLNFVNNFLTVQRFSEHYNITYSKAIEIITYGKFLNDFYKYNF